MTLIATKGLICLFVMPKKASAGPQLMLGRTLLKKYGIVFPNRGRRKHEWNEPGGGG